MSSIVSIHSYRRGTGKTDIAANLAAQVALAHRRVGLLDADLHSPGVHVPFGLTADGIDHRTPRTLNEYLRGECGIQDTAWLVGERADEAAGRAQLLRKDLWIFPSSTGYHVTVQAPRDRYDVSRLNAGLRDLRRLLRLDYLLVDTQPGLNEETLLQVAVSDVLIVVMRPSQRDFQGTAVVVDIARSLDVPAIMLVVNMALVRYDFAQMREDFEQAYGTPVAGILPFSEDMLDLDSEDIFSLLYPNHPLSQAIQDVSRVLLDLRPTPERRIPDRLREGIASGLTGMEPRLSYRWRRRE